MNNENYAKWLRVMKNNKNLCQVAINNKKVTENLCRVPTNNRK